MYVLRSMIQSDILFFLLNYSGLCIMLCFVYVSVPCHKTFVIYFEHARERPEDYIAPLSDFLELPMAAQDVRSVV